MPDIDFLFLCVEDKINNTSICLVLMRHVICFCLVKRDSQESRPIVFVILLPTSVHSTG